ncbi:MAG: hypothetical protein PVJ08_06305 [Dehalococcoidia bacterium]|jgi:hypothetical protein
MPVLRDIPVQLKKQEVLRRQGFGGGGKARPEIVTLTDELLHNVESDKILDLKASYEIYTVKEIKPELVSLEGVGQVNGSLIPTAFPEAVELVTVVCTIGHRLEEQVTAFTRERETLRGILLDGIGSAAVDILAREACHFISEEIRARGFQAGSPVNPGMPGLPITEQANLLSLAHAGEIDVSLTVSGIMVPRKSTSVIMAVGDRMQTWSQAEICRRCNLSADCPYTVLKR